MCALKKTIRNILVLMLIVLSACGQDLSGDAGMAFSSTAEANQASKTLTETSASAAPGVAQGNPIPDGEGMFTITITAGGDSFAAKLYDNESVRVLLEQMPMTLEMADYAGQEKVASLSVDFPAAAKQTPSTIRTGDLYLWSGDSLVLFYTTFSNSYSYVPVGYVEDTAGLASALGDGNVTVAFHTP